MDIHSHSHIVRKHTQLLRHTCTHTLARTHHKPLTPSPSHGKQGTSMELDEVWYDPREEALCLLQDVVEKRGREALPRYVCA